MTKINIDEIHPGDEATVRAKIFRVGRRNPDLPASIRIGTPWVDITDIFAHIPAKREIKVGDPVTWGTGTSIYTLIAIDGNTAWLKAPDSTWHREHHLDDLRHADEAQS